MDELQEYQYFAFISFQSTDAKEAVHLQHTIERYRLPAVLCRQNASIPKHIKPLYCYLNDMHAGEELMLELKSRMERSRYLIVVCSPKAARSAYINSGIDYFVSLGRRDSIIPVIVSGVPYSGNPETECFPEALRRHFPKHPDPLQDHSILGINIHEAGIGSRRQAYDRAMLMVVARMLQLDFDGLLLRDRQRRRTRRIIATVAAMLIAAALGLTWYLSQTVDVTIHLEETTPHNTALPPCADIALRLYLDNEQKDDTLATPEETAVLRNIPPRYIGQEVRVTAFAKGYLPLDTTLTLQKEMTLPVRRDADLYGQVRFRIIGLPHPQTAHVTVDGHPVQSDADGRIEYNIPIAGQQMCYPVTVNHHTDTLDMPCGEGVVILVEP
ncbi:MAG: toll/interleukin-1 receptor domain-containing protein [Paludibacteraceae bacterium]|nr:toll/interleukin-1 receptor domain-containing protein [Paludibacteraceae bacterium]